MEQGSQVGNGEVSSTLPEGSYSFRADLNGTHFWTTRTASPITA
jgi:hypothetical protein